MTTDSVWLIERKECGYRPFLDGKWELYSCEGFGRQSDAEDEVRKLYAEADEYTQYRAVEYRRVKEGA